MSHRVLHLLAILLALLALPHPAYACPLCKEAVEANPQLAAMYNWSIALLVSLPFALVGGAAIQLTRALNPAAYRQLKKRAGQWLWPAGWLYLVSGAAALLLLFYLTTPADPVTRLQLPYAALEEQPLVNAESRLTELEDRVVVVTFFASWCGPCVEQLADLAQLRREFDRHDVTFVAINAFEDYTTPPGIPHLHDDGSLEFHLGAPDLARFLETNRITWPVLISTAGLSESFGGVGRIPTTFVFDSEGRFVKRYVNAARGTFVRPSLDVLRRDIRGALACGDQRLGILRRACLALFSGT